MTAQITLASPRLTAAIRLTGAELTSLRARGHGELMWQADPAHWGRTAPILFPVIGKSAGGQIRHKGRAYPMAAHGVVRDRAFTVTDQGADHVTLALESDAGTRGSYPFDFRLSLTYRIAGDTLVVGARLDNTGTEDMPYGFGHHPGFQWPAAGQPDKSGHSLEFETAEGDIRFLTDGLVDPGHRPGPWNGRTLTLEDAVFAEDALILDEVQSRSVTYTANGQPILRVDFEGFPMLGVWMRPGGGFICVEPWITHCDTLGFTGEIGERPGIRHLAAGASVALPDMRLQVLAGA